MSSQNKRNGFTIIEILIGSAVLAFIAIAMLPSFSRLVNNSKANSFRLACSSMVKAKMQEYVSGAVNSALVTTLGQVPNGFQYSKYRFQSVTTSASANACIADPGNTPGTPGFRENSLNNGTPAATSTTEAGLPPHLKGFQLWVNLRRYNPRRLISGNPQRDCPSTSGASQYQFLRVGDAIEVTVTGMIRTTSAVGGLGAPYGGVSDISATRPDPRLTCSLTQLVYPDKKLYRYYLTNDGRIINTQLNEADASGIAVGGNVAASQVTHFRNLWTSGSALNSPVFGGLKGIAVSPNNDRVYVLKTAELLVYTGCTDETLAITSGPTFNGVPNCPATPTFRSNISPLTVNDIAVDFNASVEGSYTTQSDVIYAIRNSGPSGTSSLLKYTVPVGGPAASVQFLDDNDTTGGYSGTGGYSLLGNSRITSIFIVPSFPLASPRILPSLYYVNSDCYVPSGTSSNSSSFCATMRNASDRSFTMEMGEALSQAIDFSN